MSMTGALLLFGTYILGGMAWGDQILVNAGPAESAMTLGELRALPPPVAGDRLLGRLAHGPVATIRTFNPPSNDRPVELLEAPTQVAEGCQRLRWMANFQIVPQTAAANAWLFHVSASREIGLAVANGCADAQYAGLSAEMDRDSGFRLLGQLQEIAAGTRKVTFSCKSPAGRSLCGSPQTIRTELARPVHLLISRDKGVALFTYTAIAPGWEPGASLYMTVRFDPARPDRVTILDMPVRDMPAPPPPFLPPPQPQ